jgi:hypothetical protein
MTSCDASILEDLPPELLKLTDRIMKIWWSEHGLANVASRLRREQEVSVFLTSYDAFVFYVHPFDIAFSHYRRRRPKRPKLMVMTKVPRHLAMGATLCLIRLRAIKTQSRVTKTARCENGGGGGGEG